MGPQGTGVLSGDGGQYGYSDPLPGEDGHYYGGGRRWWR